MCGAVIDWCGFSWEAFATLATGFAAVIAAYLLGRRQVAIQASQTKLQELSVRTELFDRRYSVYDRVERLLIEIVRTGKGPEPATERDFLIAKGEAKFLFDQSVSDGLQEIWERSVNFQALEQEMAFIFREQGHYGDGNPQRRHEQFMWISDRLGSLPELFPSMQLGGNL